MNIIITLPRSGSALAGKQYNAEGFTAVNKDAQPFSLAHVIARLKRGYSIWFHYPFSQEVADYLKGVKADKYVLLRDPRDIVVSMAHRVDEYPGTLVNYPHKGKRLNEYPMAERIDILIDKMGAIFHDFDKWRQAGLKPLYYHELDGAEIGAYKAEMTAAQIAKAGAAFGELVYLWGSETKPEPVVEPEPEPEPKPVKTVKAGRTIKTKRNGRGNV